MWVDYWGGGGVAKVGPLSNYWGGAAPPPPAGPQPSSYAYVFSWTMKLIQKVASLRKEGICVKGSRVLQNRRRKRGAGAGGGGGGGSPPINL